jgi:hypothetical protein
MYDIRLSSWFYQSYRSSILGHVKIGICSVQLIKNEMQIA